MGTLMMSSKERLRLELAGRVERKELTVVNAAQLARISHRQMQRICKRHRAEGDGGLVHRSRGRHPNNRLPDKIRLEVVSLYQEKYGDFGPTLACEKLACDGHELSSDTLGRLLKEAGLWQPRRQRSKHRLRRQRRSCFGELIQMDGSEHDWFEGRGDRAVLMVMIDDATNLMLARFFRRENLEAAFEMFQRWAEANGLPRALYVDRAGIYRADREATGEELIGGIEPVTQFGRAMKQLEVELILANSPQAKGRVERRNGLLQDRLVKEMRLAKINGIEAANAFLDSGYLAELNDRYTCRATDKADVHRVVDQQVKLDQVLCEQEQRVVGRDWCVRWNNQHLQIDKRHESLALPGKQVLVKQKRDGTLLVEHADELLDCRPVTSRPAPPRRPKPVIKNNKKWTPPATHPWKQGLPPLAAAAGG
jgi:transposase-like protein